MQPAPGIFTFDHYDADVVHGTATFFYRVDREGRTTNFQETLTFTPPPVAANIPPQIFEAVFKNLFLLSGIGYWKLWCPPTINLATTSLSKEEASFWNTIYTKGLGEFFYRNDIDFRGLVNFPVTATTAPQPQNLARKDRSLLLVGGGKDSIVSGNLLRAAKKPFANYALNPAPLQTTVMQLMGGEIISIKRELDPKIFELNAEEGTYNGHVPISVFYAMTALLAAVLYDYKFIIASNEHSANYGNVEYLGASINHQWSKSFELEQLLQNYVAQFITPDIHYFSLLRPFSEIKIVSLFAGATAYYELFSSCNRNFTLAKSEVPHRWCGQCAKCAFVFAALAAFLSKEELFKIFGKNLFADPLLLPTYRDLLGLTNMKPFDCVGTPEEVALAFLLAREKDNYGDDAIMTMFTAEAEKKFSDKPSLISTLLEKTNESKIPEEFREILSRQ